MLTLIIEFPVHSTGKTMDLRMK